MKWKHIIIIIIKRRMYSLSPYYDGRFATKPLKLTVRKTGMWVTCKLVAESHLL